MADVTAQFNQNLFLALAPAFPKLSLTRYEGQRTGDEIDITLDFGLWKSRWLARILSSWQDAKTWGFIDEGTVLPFPFTYWHHKHLVEAQGDSACLVIDAVHFAAGPYWLSVCMRPIVVGMLQGREPQYKRYFRAQNSLTPPQ